MTDTATATPAADAAAPPAADTSADAKGLLDDVKSVKDAPAVKDPNVSDIAHLAEDPTKAAQDKLAQKRERPASVPEKFWDKEKGEPRLDEFGRSYLELEKNFKLGKHKPPADGKYDLTPLADKIPADDPLLGKYTEWATKHGLSQTAFEELANQVVELAGGAASELQVSQKAERAALGEKADAIIGSMVDWAQGLVASGVWTTEDFEEFKIMGGTAKGMLALMRLRESYEGRVPLKETIPQDDIGVSDAELEAMVGDPKYKTNEGGFRDKVEKMYERRYGNMRAA
jgi:hypothetical protein